MKEITLQIKNDKTFSLRNNFTNFYDKTFLIERIIKYNRLDLFDEFYKIYGFETDYNLTQIILRRLFKFDKIKWFKKYKFEKKQMFKEYLTNNFFNNFLKYKCINIFNYLKKNYNFVELNKNNFNEKIIKYVDILIEFDSLYINELDFTKLFFLEHRIYDCIKQNKTNIILYYIKHNLNRLRNDVEFKENILIYTNIDVSKYLTKIPNISYEDIETMVKHNISLTKVNLYINDNNFLYFIDCLVKYNNINILQKLKSYNLPETVKIFINDDLNMLDLLVKKFNYNYKNNSIVYEKPNLLRYYNILKFVRNLDNKEHVYVLKYTKTGHKSLLVSKQDLNLIILLLQIKTIKGDDCIEIKPYIRKGLTFKTFVENVIMKKNRNFMLNLINYSSADS